jgi:hypothetical protein
MVLQRRPRGGVVISAQRALKRRIEIEKVRRVRARSNPGTAAARLARLLYRRWPSKLLQCPDFLPCANSGRAVPLNVKADRGARQTNPDDCLLFGRMFRFVPLAMRVLEQNETAGRYVPLISVTGLVPSRSIEPYREHAFRHRMPIYLSRVRRNARETDACRHIIRRY